MTASVYWVPFLDDENVLTINCENAIWSHSSVNSVLAKKFEFFHKVLQKNSNRLFGQPNIPKTIDLYHLNARVVWYVNYIPVKLLPKK